MILHLDGLEEPFVSHGRGGLMTQCLGAAAGSERLYVNIDTVPPGAYSAKYHSHSNQEEFFLILSGSGTLRMDGEEYTVSKGDFVAKPAGRGIAHQFQNSGAEPLVILDTGTQEREDVVHYPDEGVRLVKSCGQHRIAGADEGWTSDPNEG
jgi:uncharacterized cupin superfamily protein